MTKKNTSRWHKVDTPDSQIKELKAEHARELGGLEVWIHENKRQLEGNGLLIQSYEKQLEEEKTANYHFFLGRRLQTSYRHMAAESLGQSVKLLGNAANISLSPPALYHYSPTAASVNCD